MSTESRNKDKGYTDQLSEFESQLRHTLDDQSLQRDVFRAIRELLQTHKQSESDIREILRQRFESGQLREETLHIVQKMLARASYELDDTLPEDAEEPNFSETDVLPRDTGIARRPQQQLQAGSILRDRFMLQRRVSGGSMGEVYKALDRRMAEVEGVEPWVAIKVLNARLSKNAAALRAIQQEAAKGRALLHPNIVRFIDLDREDDLYFLVMEWIEGQSLAAILDAPDSRKLPLEQVISIIDQLADALEYAHQRGVVHADVKPGNVMLTPDDKIKLIDFGIARVRQSDTEPARSHDPKIPGAVTPAYSSMQVLTGEEPVPSDDVFSLACLTYRLLAGYRVFGPRNAAEAADEGMSPQCPQGLSDGLWKVLKKALSFSRVTRFSSARGFADDFIAAARQAPEPSATASAEDEPERPRSGGGLAKFLVGTAVAAAVAGLAVTQTDLLDRLGISLPDLAPTTVQPPDVQKADTGEPADAPLEPEEIGQSASVEGPAESTAPSTGSQPEPLAADADTELQVAPDPTEVTTETAASPAESEADSAPARSVGIALLEATHTLQINTPDGSVRSTEVIIREDAGNAVIDIERLAGLDEELVVIIEERQFDGNGSPWESGQYQVAGDGSMSFVAGQSIAQLEISMSSDPLREADRRAELLLRSALDGSELGIIDLRLEDDDQRRFEARLPPNTVGFAVSQVSVLEGETAAQIDLVRYNPDQTSLRVTFDVQDVTATNDEDYFAPASRLVEFGPGERSARILIPLVQDTSPEDDEAFFLELAVLADSAGGDIFRRIAVMIRDDD